MANEITIPILPCRSITETLTFYGVLGFEVTYQQTKPNSYACVRRGDLELHFFALRELDPAQSYSTCLVVVPDADELYRAFAAGLRQAYGKLPVAGIPRITPSKNRAGGGRGFNVIDPGGNWIRITQKTEISQSKENSALDKAASTKLTRAIQTANLLADSKGDYITAAKVLDLALAQDEVVPAVERVQALIARAGMAIALGDQPLARKLLTEVQGIPLDATEQITLRAELERANDLEQTLK